jgi:hypothetical protein
MKYWKHKLDSEKAYPASIHRLLWNYLQKKRVLFGNHLEFLEYVQPSDNIKRHK